MTRRFSSQFLRRKSVLLLAGLTLLLVLAGFWAYTRYQAIQFVDSLEKRGAWFVETASIGPDWLPYLIGHTTVRFSSEVIKLHSGTAVLTDGDVAEIAKWFRPAQLTLTGSNIDDAALRHLERMNTLTFLELRNTSVTDKGLTHLTEMKRLVVLDISGTSITNDGLVHLSQMTNLRELFANGTKITPAGAEQLKSALPNCKIYGQDSEGRYWWR